MSMENWLPGWSLITGFVCGTMDAVIIGELLRAIFKGPDWVVVAIPLVVLFMIIWLIMWAGFQLESDEKLRS